ncbi:MAG: AAA family ATPase [Okeania sp. SIO3I5]|uniref:AAA family ATPase n=1 Tax=Okeania sp. SIO3I5 TaxID=2607805 RepID=UPI0013B798AE|nr:AAA family ATPase [Okeania sp. SIO3I5]NEQ36404.1 AAA family ATPase [Okeania sp. SIO3I5]
MIDSNTNYQIIAKVYESDNSLIYRAILKPDNQAIILKILKENYPTPSQLTQYRQEYEILRSLDVDSIIKAYDLQRYENSLIMLLEDFGGESLKSLLPQSKLNLENFLTIAIKTTESLAAIHQANIIHKDINPANIVYHSQTGQLKIIDFGISTRLSQEFLTVLLPHQLEGTLAYIAPEQTGRMNRGIDYRCDLYSLGVTFYELLTNKLPFETTDPMELVHCHIAQQPLPVHKLIPDVPNSVSNIVSKLLAKTPEERYQSAWGIKADLETCLHQLKTLGEISNFPLGNQDISDKFQIPQKLYGREQEVTQLLTAFEQVSQGKTGMILISGYSGIGKSALVNEIHKPIAKKRGRFISGKFDQLQRDIPYSAISQAFQELIRKLLSEPEITLQNWKNKLLEALGNNGQIIIDVIPELEKIIGKQPAVEQLGSTESQNRFNLLFQRFLSVFCQKENPLVIFIDDLQWADLPSLNLIEQLMSDSDNKYFLTIGAYRDNEVSHTHPLVSTLEKIKNAQVPVNEITLYPLKSHHINQLIADTLSCSTEITKPLAELVAKKTGGNPFFLTQLLYSLYQENLLVFNREKYSLKIEDNRQGYWQWDIEEIQRVSITDNVVELMVGKIEKLDQKTQQVLKLAACIGNNFNLEILSIVNNKSQVFTAKEIQLALDEGLIIPLNNNYKVPLLWSLEELPNNSSDISSQNSAYIPYKFLHDRVQQAAYSLIPEAKKKQVHLQIGRLLLKNLKKTQEREGELQNNIFDIVNQLNEGSDLITEQLEKDELAKFNLQAGKKSKASTAYEPALKYLELGLKLLAINSWKNNYQLTIELHLETLEVLYLNGKLSQAQNLDAIILEKSNKLLDKVKVYDLKINYYRSQLQLELAIDSGLEILKLLGLNLPKKPGKMKILAKHFQVKLLLKKTQIEDLAELPQITDPNQVAAVNILSALNSPAYSTNQNLHYLIILNQVYIHIKYGNSEFASAAYVWYASYLCERVENIDLGYRFGQLSLKLSDKLTLQSLKPIVLHMFYGFVKYWKNNSSKELKPLVEVVQTGLEYGEIAYSSYAAANYCYISLFYSGENLQSIHKKVNEYISLFAKYKDKYGNDLFVFCEKFCSYLINIDGDRNTFAEKSEKDNGYDINFYINNNLYLLVLFAALFENTKFYFLKYYSNAIEYSNLCEKYKAFGSSVNLIPQCNFYQSLTLLALALKSNKNQQKKILLKKVSSNQKQMKKWAQKAPKNYQNKYDLVEAEKARVLGQNWQAQELYDRAIQGAKKYEFIHEEALAYERAAEFYLALGREEIGQLYLRNSHHCYIRWGAKAKVKQLESEYPQYLLGATDRSKSKGINTSISLTGTRGEILDLTTVIKASQAISGEIKLENLLRNLMKILIENAGAQTGFLILNHEGSWVIEAQGKINSDEVTILQSIPVEFVDPETSIPILPTTIINYVIHSQENIVLNDAANQGQFINDPYIIATKSKSILCTPLINQGKLSGIIYLENNLTTGAFTSKRVELLNILSSQAAISIDNSRLYSQVRENESRLTQFLDAVPVGVAIIDASGHPYYFNQIAKELLGKEVVSDVTSEQIASTYQLYKISTNQEYPSEELPITRALQGESLTTEDVYVRQGDKIIPLESFSKPVYDEKGKITYAIGSFIDITERKKAEFDRERFTIELFHLNKAYERFVPKQFLELLDKESIVDVRLGDQVQLEMSVLFSDVRNFTTMSEAMTPEENFRFINSFLSRMEPAILENQGFIDKYIGDAIMALFSGDADNALKAGISMLERLNKYNQERMNSGDPPIGIGVGINTGLLMLGTVGGQNRMDGSVISDAVNLAARVESLTKNYGVSLLITEQTFSQLTQPSNYAIRSIDTVKVKGKSQKVTVYEVFDTDLPEIKEGKLKSLEKFTEAISLCNSGQSLAARRLFTECLKINPSDQVAKIYLQRLFVP